MHSDPTKLVNFWSGDVLKSETVHFCSLFFTVGKIYLKHSLQTYHQHRGFCYRCRSDFFFHFLSKLVMLLEKIPGSFWTRCKSVCLEVPEYWNIFNRSISTLEEPWLKFPFLFIAVELPIWSVTCFFSKMEYLYVSCMCICIIHM